MVEDTVIAAVRRYLAELAGPGYSCQQGRAVLDIARREGVIIAA